MFRFAWPLFAIPSFIALIRVAVGRYSQADSPGGRTRIFCRPARDEAGILLDSTWCCHTHRLGVSNVTSQNTVFSRRFLTGAMHVVEASGAGFDAVVGGAVRDLLLGKKPKDFDVATDATPEQIKQCFRSARIIGRRFQIVHVRSGREIIEVTTFRGHHDSQDAGQAAQASQSGRLLRDNVYGSLDDDARRRDLTFNALYYDTVEHTLIDKMNGQAMWPLASFASLGPR